MREALRILLRCATDRFPQRVIRKLDLFPESGMSGWTVAVKTKDGRIFREVEIGYGFLGIGHFVHIFGDQSWKLPFRLRDVVDVEWEGYRVGNTIERPEPFREEWRFTPASSSP